MAGRMPGPVELIMWSMVAWLAAVTSIVLYGLLTGSIRTDGLLRERSETPIVADRTQLFLFSLGGAGAYLLFAFGHVGAPALPDIPPSWVALIGGSQVLYLAPKLMRRLGRM